MNLDRRATEIYLGSAVEYLRWLTDKRIPASDWFKDGVAERYRSDISKSEDAERAILRSLEVAARHCDAKGVQLSEFFKTITPGELSSALEVGRISPWLLVSSERFEDLMAKITEPQLERMSLSFDVEYWMRRVELCPEVSARVSDIVRSVGL